VQLILGNRKKKDFYSFISDLTEYGERKYKEIIHGSG
jgi:hypothetical protein